MADTLAPPEAAGPGRHRLEAPRPWRPSPAGMIARLVVITGLIAFALSTPLMMPGIQVNILSRVITFVIIALSLNILIGYTGQISLGHSAFMGVGAFTAGVVITNAGLPWIFAQAIAIGIGAVAALILGFVALRVKGLYLALVTLAYGLFAQFVIFPLGPISRGGAGMPADRPEWAMGDVAYAYVCLAALALVWVLDWRLTSSRAGRAIQALRDSEKVAASWGINVTGFKLLAFVISGAIAGLAGGLFASIEQLVSPITFDFQLSLLFLFMAVIGGAGSRPGVVVGALLLGFLPFFLDVAASRYEFPLDGSAAGLVGALFVLGVLLWFPGGIAQLLGGVFRWLSFKPFSAGPGDASPGAVEGGGADARP
jgi:branched-chain amino acid transport system permease protein